MKTISILGSTGSIGIQTLEILATRRSEFRVAWLTTKTRIDVLEKQAAQFQPSGVVVADEEAYHKFKRYTTFNGTILCGEQGVCEAASDASASILVSSLVGFSGVVPTFCALEQGIPIALANKETLVSAGSVITELSQARGVPIIAVDSEHSAILQCVIGERVEDVDKLILTASGGPFRTYTAEQLSTVTCAQALKHPNWSMGAKITIDSATLMNKGLEVIEARWLFNIGAERIEVVVHPQSIIHSMVQFVDGSVKAQMGLPDMKVPIAYALSFPHRMALDDTLVPRMNLAAIGLLEFSTPNTTLFPCLRLAFEALDVGGFAPAVLNAANEIAVAAFLEERIGFMDIPRLIEQALEAMTSQVSYASTTNTGSLRSRLDDVVALDTATREFTRAKIREEYSGN